MPKVRSSGRDLILRTCHALLNLAQNHTEVDEAIRELSEKERHQGLMGHQHSVHEGPLRTRTIAAPAAAAAIRPMKLMNSSNFVEKLDKG